MAYHFSRYARYFECKSAGFRKRYSTVDHIFVLNSLIETLTNQKKKFFVCAFIDFSQAFDNVWRIGLWRKLLGPTVQGKFLRVIYNMYSGIKSCDSVNNEYSGYFISNLGGQTGWEFITCSLLYISKWPGRLFIAEPRFRSCNRISIRRNVYIRENWSSIIICGRYAIISRKLT